MNRLKFHIKSLCTFFAVIFIALTFASGSYAQDSQEYLRKGIAYYQNLEFEKSLEFFDKALELDSNNINIIARRGYVCAKYIRAIDDKKVPSVSSERYKEIVNKGIADLTLALKEFDGNDDNKRSLAYLKTKI